MLIKTNGQKEKQNKKNKKKKKPVWIMVAAASKQLGYSTESENYGPRWP